MKILLYKRFYLYIFGTKQNVYVYTYFNFEIIVCLHAIARNNIGGVF